MNILAPWSLSSYLPLDGFHPMYRSLASSRAPDVRIFTPKTPRLPELRKLVARGFCRQGAFTFAPPGKLGASGDGLFEEFAEGHGARDLWLQFHLPGDVELHHTAPATCGDRPFLLHCESFLPVFFPFLQQEKALDERHVTRVRAFYRNLFESENCFAIVSHVPETLVHLSFFFQSDSIDKKLVGMPTGLDAAYIAKDIEKSTTTTKFIFLNSAYQHVQSFALWGGFSCLKLALDLLRSRDDVMFYFRTRRPSDNELAGHGIDLDDLKQHEATKIVWVEHYLSEEMLNTLIAKCHFLLLPSANLHSVVIMSAMANGTIPIVTDTIGTDVYVEDMVTGVVIRGVRAEIWTKNETLRITHDRHSRFHEIEGRVTTSLILKVREVLDKPDQIREMANAGRRAISQRFDGATFADRLVEEIRTRSVDRLKNNADLKKHRLAASERWIEDISHAHFMGPTQPFERVKLPHGNVIQLRREFFFVPFSSLDLTAKNEFWSPIPWWGLDEFSAEFPKNAGVIRASSLSECVKLAREGARLGSTPPHCTACVIWSRGRWIWRHPRRALADAWRKVYRIPRRLGDMR